MDALVVEDQEGCSGALSLRRGELDSPSEVAERELTLSPSCPVLLVSRRTSSTPTKKHSTSTSSRLHSNTDSGPS